MRARDFRAGGSAAQSVVAGIGDPGRREVEFVYPDEALCLAVAEIKALFPLSFADAFVAATARQAKGILYHKDPEFDSLKDTVRLKALPYKARR